MTAYLLLFAVPASMALWQALFPRSFAFDRRMMPLWIAMTWLLLTLAVGLRYEVGGDWIHYQRYWLQRKDVEWDELAIQFFEPGYTALGMYLAKAGYPIQAGNLFCAALFAAGLVAFCWQWPRPWIALTASVPYLVIVVGMGYTRQSVAIGLLLLALVFTWGSQWSYRLVSLAAVVGAVSFHKAALAIAAIAFALRHSARHRQALLLGALAATTLLFIALPDLGDKVLHVIHHYLIADTFQSRGTLVRALMTSGAGIVFLLFQSRLTLAAKKAAALQIASWCAIGLGFLALLTPTSTPLDRMGLYLLPLQLAVCAVLPDAVSKPIYRAAVQCLFVFAYAVLMGVWFAFSPFARFWVPYRWALPW
jgi:hypothetical protein